MSEAYERERQNDARLDELSAKVSALRGVTIDIYDSARSHEVIESTVRPPKLQRRTPKGRICVRKGRISHNTSPSTAPVQDG